MVELDNVSNMHQHDGGGVLQCPQGRAVGEEMDYGSAGRVFKMCGVTYFTFHSTLAPAQDIDHNTTQHVRHCCCCTRCKVFVAQLIVPQNLSIEPIILKSI